MYIRTHINHHTFVTKVLQTPRQLAEGMMGKRFDGKFHALLFVMDKPESSFWMSGCIVPLDVIFIQNGIISRIYHSCPPCVPGTKCKTYPGKGELVIEIPGGTCKELHIRRGDQVQFSKKR